MGKGRPKVDDKLASKSIRISPKTWEKLEWKASKAGVPVQECLRNTLNDCLAEELPPVSLISREFGGSETDWQRWGDLMAELGVADIGEIIRPLLHKLCDKQLGTS